MGVMDALKTIYLLSALGGVLIAMLVLILKAYFDNPFDYPEIVVTFDISGKRNPDYDDYIDNYIINNMQHRKIKDYFDDRLNDWNYNCKAYLQRCVLWKNHRTEIYHMMHHKVLMPDYGMFVFIFVRNQTRYHQENYQRHAYVVKNTDNIIEKTLDDMIKRKLILSSFDYETTFSKYNTKNQRALMTKELKDRIKERDNYTCQICGKYMPDEVGLHIDHIIPIAKGGKSIYSNLWVTCDKCNLRKGSKIL